MTNANEDKHIEALDLDGRIKILDGPTCEDMFLALRRRHEGRRATFGLKAVLHPDPEMIKRLEPFEPGAPMPEPIAMQADIEMQVDRIGVEDGSGNNWLLKLSPSSRTGTIGVQLSAISHFDVYYNTNRRKGWAEPVQKR